MAKKRGRLIVIDGSDGSGKATQAKKLVEAMRARRARVRTLDFPRYEDNFFGAFIGRCIIGKHGDFVALDPYITSIVYAADRFESSAQIKKWLDEGCTVVLDRYVSANQIHQGGKISDPHRRRDFLAWLHTMEYEIFKLPQPDMVIYLDVPLNMSVKLLAGAQNKKSYLKEEGDTDLVEHNVAYLRNARNSALWLARHETGWHKIQCVKDDQLRTIDDIHEEMLSLTQR